MGRWCGVGDLNGDGKPDIVLVLVASSSSTTATVGAPVEFSAWRCSESLALGDLNGDGRLDLVGGIPGLACPTPQASVPSSPVSSLGGTLGSSHGAKFGSSHGAKWPLRCCFRGARFRTRRLCERPRGGRGDAPTAECRRRGARPGPLRRGRRSRRDVCGPGCQPRDRRRGWPSELCHKDRNPRTRDPQGCPGVPSEADGGDWARGRPRRQGRKLRARAARAPLSPAGDPAVPSQRSRGDPATPVARVGHPSGRALDQAPHSAPPGWRHRGPDEPLQPLRARRALP
ncbi:MAG: VCBS repeat-containing protein [Deltaproteobacteria bacterium]|nr:VCBS repeat-containing protein [Deltaproteobacteria bacterium]